MISNYALKLVISEHTEIHNELMCTLNKCYEITSCQRVSVYSYVCIPYITTLRHCSYVLFKNCLLLAYYQVPYGAPCYAGPNICCPCLHRNCGCKDIALMYINM